MSVGLYDADIKNYTGAAFNLELMKYATYYKKKNQVVTLTPFLQPERYSIFIYRQDYASESYPKSILKKYNYGGYAFTNGLYVPLDEQIERQPADVSIYEDFTWFSWKGKTEVKKLPTMRNSSHCRLSLDNSTVWDNFESQLKNQNKNQIIFHDYALPFISNSLEIIQDLITDYDVRAIGTKFPIIIKSQEELYRWTRLPFLCDFRKFLIFCDFDDEFWYEYGKDPQLQKYSANFNWYVTSTSSDSNDFIVNHLSKIYRQVSFLRSLNYKITLKTEEGFSSDSLVDSLVKIISGYGKSGENRDDKEYQQWLKEDSLIRYIKKLINIPQYFDTIISDWNRFTILYADLTQEFRQTGGIEYRNGKFDYDTKRTSY